VVGDGLADRQVVSESAMLVHSLGPDTNNRQQRYQHKYQQIVLMDADGGGCHWTVGEKKAGFYAGFLVFFGLPRIAADNEVVP
jgi:hypothetical protein